MSSRLTQPIRIGLMAPLTGIVSLYGEDICRAAQIAVNRINAQGGVVGVPIELLVEDDGSLPDTALTAARRLLERRCQVLIGNLLSNSRIAVARQVAAVQRIPYLNFSFYEGSIANRYFFHFAALPNQQIDQAVALMAQRHGPKMYFAGNNYEWPRGSIDAAKRALRQVGGEVLGEHYLPLGAGEDDIEWLLDGLQTSGADVFVPYFAGSDQIQVLKRFAARGLSQSMAVLTGHFDELMASCLSPEMRAGIYSTNTYFMTLNTPENQALLADLAHYPGVLGNWPEGHGFLTNFGEGTWVCVTAAAEAMRLAGSLDAEALVTALEQVRLKAPQGEVRMDARTHHAHINSYLARCTEAGRLELVQAFGAIAPVIPARYRDHFKVVNLQAAPAVAEAAAHPGEMATATDQQLAELRQVLAIADMAVITADEQGMIREANPSAERLFGYQSGELCGMSVHDLVPPHMRTFHEQVFQQFVVGEPTQRRMGQRGQIMGYRKDGSFFPMEAAIAKFRHGNHWVLVTTLRDLIDVQKAEQALNWRTTHDPLTGLANRVLFHDRLANALERARRSGASVAVLLVDLDGFKQVNDHYSHRLGDALLRHHARLILEQVGAGDIVARLAGDEFAVLCEHVTERDRVAALAERIVMAMREPQMIDGVELLLSCSIGVVLGQGATHNADELLRTADLAMYEVKQKGRDGWQFFSDALQTQAARRMALAQGLRSAIERNELYPLFQPIVHTENEMTMGAELLLRWRHGDEEISPAEFIPVAESCGLIRLIGLWVFEQACLAVARWQGCLPERGWYLSVNVSACQLDSDALPEEFAAILQTTGAMPRHLVLEVTESSLMADVQTNRIRLEALSALGMKIAVDDFGTGYSSLAQLLRLKVDTLKIDREFIRNIEHSEDSQAVAAAICRMAKALRLRLIAEGVETPGQRDIVRTLGIDAIQGYWYGRPMSEVELVARMQDDTHLDKRPKEKQVFLIYASRCHVSVSVDDLTQILAKARRFNRSVGITGYLLYLGDAFLQYLEGPEDAVLALYEHICHDPRHYDVVVLAQGCVSRRLFIDWSMGFQQVQASQLKAGADLSDETCASYEQYRANPALCCDLFEAISSNL
ncbi:MAG: EAL domain-containing protein [Methylococcales bacterium]|nr:EAL domain-containing protein [Methylococcales bacterium]